MSGDRAVFTYHSIDESGSVISVSPAVFRSQMEYLSKAEVAVVTVDKLLSDETGAAIAITFDDAFANFSSHAWPVLRDLGLISTVYVPTGLVGKTNSWDAETVGIPELSILTWDRLGELGNEGVQIGSHTATHADLSSLAENELEEEMGESLREIETNVGTRPTTFCYPYGRYSAAAVTAVARFGYLSGVTTDLGFVGHSVDQFRVPRLDAYYFREARAIEAWGTAQFRRYIRLRRLGRRLRSIWPNR